METFQLKSVKDDMTILLLKASVDRLADMASKMKLPVLLDEDLLKDATESGFNNTIDTFEMIENEAITPLTRYKYLTGML